MRLYKTEKYGGPQLSWQNQKPHGKNKNIAAKPKPSRQNQIRHSNWPNTSRQKQIPTAKPKLFCFCCEVFGFAVRYFVLALRFLVLLWGILFLPWCFCFGREVFGFAVTVMGHHTETSLLPLIVNRQWIAIIMPGTHYYWYLRGYELTFNSFCWLCEKLFLKIWLRFIKTVGLIIEPVFKEHIQLKRHDFNRLRRMILTGYDVTLETN